MNTEPVWNKTLPYTDSEILCLLLSWSKKAGYAAPLKWDKKCYWTTKSPSYSQIPHLIFQGESLLAETLQNHFLPLSSLWNSTLFPCRELRCKGVKTQRTAVTDQLTAISNKTSLQISRSRPWHLSEAPQTEQRLKNFILYANGSNKDHNPTVIFLNGTGLTDWW